MKTPCKTYKKINKYFALKVYLKREDLNPNGSHKDRSIPIMIDYYAKKGVKNFVISSSGNAAISAIKYCQKHNFNLNIFLPPNTPNYKLKKILNLKSEENFKKNNLKSNPKNTNEKIYTLNPKVVDKNKNQNNIHFTKRAVSDAFKFAKKHNYQLLRSSKDPIALKGYKKLAKELNNQLKEITDIFVPSSSGTLAIGLYQGFKDLMEIQPKIHIIQTTKINTLVRDYDTNFKKSKKSIAQAIVDRVGHRKKDIDKIINEKEGYGWVVNDKNIKRFYKILKESGINSSEEGAMGLAALEKAISQGLQIKKPVCIITGSKTNKDTSE